METETENNKVIAPAPSWHCVNGLLYMGPPSKTQQTNEHVISVPNNVKPFVDLLFHDSL